jgi:hypothetical protein
MIVKNKKNKKETGLLCPAQRYVFERLLQRKQRFGKVVLPERVRRLPLSVPVLVVALQGHGKHFLSGIHVLPHRGFYATHSYVLEHIVV